jgi:HD-GYP domain-containing protein (c-di-GMP phosphodiesterase class II)
MLRLRGISGPTKGRVWESDSLLRAGRLGTLEIALDDNSVSRKHAEVAREADGLWYVRDNGSTNGTYLNGARLGTEPLALRPRDVVQFGKVAMLAEFADAGAEGPQSDQLVVTASTKSDPDGAGLRHIAFDSNNMPRAGDQLLALLRAGHHLVHIEREEELLTCILNDCVSVLDAQRGAIVLADGDGAAGAEPKMRIRALSVGHGESKGRFHFSKRLTQRCFAKGESVLFCNVLEEKELTHSISDGEMTSVMCVLLRTPRKKLGVLHVDRGPGQLPFTKDDLLLADALAAHVSAGIECSHLLTKQRDMFLRTITMLAQMVELRDKYTGGHTQRVTRYSLLIAEHLALPDDQIDLVKLGTPLHDIGKVGISDEILQAPRRLTAAEFAVMQTHTTMGADYLRGVPELEPILPIVLSHHERWDGTGYPERLSKEEIPLLARIVAVADAFDAMTSHRPYHDKDKKRGRDPEEAFAEVARQSGRQFDPLCAEAFLAVKSLVLASMADPDSDTAARLATLETLLPAPDSPTPPDGLPGAGEAAEYGSYLDMVPVQSSHPFRG